MKLLKKKSGFTLIELLIVIGVIAILAALAFVALNPLARFQDARNAQRWTDVNAVLAALKLDQVDNGGAYLTGVAALTSGAYYQIGDGEACNDNCSAIELETACIDLGGLVTEGYLSSVPIDPNDSNANASETRYYLVVHTNNSITIGSCSEEAGSGASTPNISVTR